MTMMITVQRAGAQPRVFARAAILVAALAVGGGAALGADHPARAPRLTGLGDLEMPVTTRVDAAQAFFNQGIRLLYAFNHEESRRAFEEAARLDPTLALAHWGQAMALAPNLNAPLPEAQARRAYAALEAALRLGHAASTRERGLINALARRLAADPGGPRAGLDADYAAAMRRLAARYPGDPDIQVLFVDAVMNTMPWNYWQKDGQSKPETAEIAAVLERVIATHPRHPGAHHYYIHLMEASSRPERAEASADVLADLMPSAGHIVHMPAHIYLRIGRYADAADINVRAIAADEDYLAQCQAQGLYPVSYYPHNLHFLWAAATFEGRSATAIDAARAVAAKVPHHHAGALAWTADFPVTTWLALIRFGQWKEMLLEPAPPVDQPYAQGIWRYGRALAFVAGAQPARADAEMAALDAVMAHPAFTTTLKDLPLLTNLRIARRMAAGELAASRGDTAAGIALLKEAVEIEDALPYSEPPIWHHPARQVLGALLVESGQPAAAEAVYRQDLGRFRENGWSLYGLARSLEDQGRLDDAHDAWARFTRAWRRADIRLTSSRVLRAAAPKTSEPTLGRN